MSQCSYNFFAFKSLWKLKKRERIDTTPGTSLQFQIFLPFFFPSLSVPPSLANRAPESLLITNNTGFHTLLEQMKFL